MVDEELVVFVDASEASRGELTRAAGAELALLTLSSAAEALRLLEQRPVAVVVIDQLLPRPGGDPLLREVRNRWPSTQRVVLCSHNDLSHFVAAGSEGAIARYLTKPWPSEPVLAALRWAIDAHRLGRADPAACARLLDTERLALIGSFVSAILHEAAQPLMAVANNVHHLRLLGGTLTTALRDDDAALRREVAAVAAEVPAVLDDVSEGVELLDELVRRVRSLRG